MNTNDMHQVSKPVIILGAGGHAKVVFDILQLTGAEIIGIISPDETRGRFCFGIEVLGNDEVVATYSPEDVILANGIGHLVRKDIRKKISVKMRQQGYSFASLVHPSATIAGDVDLAEGVQIMAGAIIQPGTSVSEDSIINSGAIVDHDCKIGKNCHVAPGAVCCGNVHIGDNTFIGAGATIIQNIRIGESSVIAAGATIYKDIPSGLIYISSDKLLNNETES